MNKEIRTYKVELKPNNKQKSLFHANAGTARFAYNWGLSVQQENYKNGGKFLTAIDLHKLLIEKKKSGEFAWMYQYSKCSPQSALRNLEKAYKRFFDYIKKNKKGVKCRRVGYPKHKKKNKARKSFTLDGTIKIIEGQIQLPTIGKVSLKEKSRIPENNKIRSATISEKSGRWFVSVTMKEEVAKTLPNLDGEIIGIDLGIKTMAVLSDGREFTGAKALKKNLVKLRRVSRQHSKKQKGSKNKEKSRKRLAKVHYTISNVRKDVQHKATSAIVRAKTKPKAIVMETLNIAGMVKNRKLARHISDVGMYEFTRQMEYKCLRNNVEFIKANMWFPSSKTCSSCGLINENLTLSDRVWTCECGAVLDRDRNAAQNLASYYHLVERNTVSSTGINAFGDDVRLECNQATVGELGNKQESFCGIL